jgi:type IV secretory pathway VirB10-like protein
MRAARVCSSFALLVVFCTGCLHKSSPPPQAQAPPLQTGKGTLSPQTKSQQQEKTDAPLASPLPPPSAQNVPPLPPPQPKKVHKPKRPAAKPADTAQAPAAGGASQPSGSGSQTSAQATPQQTPGAAGTPSPIGQLTTGDSAMGEKAKHETADLISSTEQGLSGIKRSLSTEEKVTAAQIRTFLKQAQQALDNGDTDGAHGLALKAKLLLDELTKP